LARLRRGWLTTPQFRLRLNDRWLLYYEPRQPQEVAGVGDGNRKHPETATKELTRAQMTILRIVST
jgi:hypothetical protein